MNIIQLPDMTWSSDQRLLDDMEITPPGYTSNNPLNNIMLPGLRTDIASGVVEQAAQIINKYAPADVQRNALYTLSTTTSGTPYTNAKATMDWVASVNSYRDTQTANVKTLNFDQLVAYVVPTGYPPWPTPPSFLTPA
jgi:hypothetical protein